SEDKYCVVCGKPLRYSAVHYGQLGFYYCTCGFRRPAPSAAVQQIDTSNGVAIKVKGSLYQSHLKGAYNAYNMVAAIGCAKLLGVQSEDIQRGLAQYQPNNGRMESFLHGKTIMNLSKNAQGINST